VSKHSAVPYGSWKSPITSELIASRTTGVLDTYIGLGEITLDGEDLYWFELRPRERGRRVILRMTPEEHATDHTPAWFSASTRVHEIGGAAFAVSEGTIYFSNFTDNLVYRQDPGRPPKAITSDSGLRYADFAIDETRHRLICVREDHTVESREPVNTLVSISLDGDDVGQVLVSGNDFYSSPRLSPDSS